MLKESPADAELLQMRGRCAAGELRYDEAAEWYSNALQQAPDRIELSVEYAALLREGLKMPEMANERIEAMVRANERSPEARLEAAKYFRQFGLWRPRWARSRPRDANHVKA